MPWETLAALKGCKNKVEGFFYIFRHLKSIPLCGYILYDIPLMPYNVYVGGGIKQELNDRYRAAKAGERIIVSL